LPIRKSGSEDFYRLGNQEMRKIQETEDGLRKMEVHYMPSVLRVLSVFVVIKDSADLALKKPYPTISGLGSVPVSRLSPLIMEGGSD